MIRHSKSVVFRRAAALLVLVVAGLLLFGWMSGHRTKKANAPTSLTLVVPDGIEADDIYISVWRDAASEIGVALDVVNASQLLRPDRVSPTAALILPDNIHRHMNATFVANVHDRVRRGARLMLVYDAGVEDIDDGYSPSGSRFSDLAGVQYALFGQHGDDMHSEPTVHIDPGAVELLALPPGKVVYHDSGELYSINRPPPKEPGELSLATYMYGHVRYPVFKTQGPFKGKRLMHGESQDLIAGHHQVGLGEVLFVNLPLTFLKLRTDGLLLHSFLRYFAQKLVQLPQLSPMPGAKGALILNWHIDSGAVMQPLEAMDAMGTFEQGPYSAHLTAGPDVYKTGDGLGMNLPQNPIMQKWVQRFAARGDEVGSHGGWIHNEFASMLGIWPREKSTELIDMNIAAVSAASGRPAREYSAPMGHHPLWVTHLLRERGIHAYYFTGDTGMPPTRSYHKGTRSPADVWAFPVMNFGPYASFEEAKAEDVPEDDIARWLLDMADFCDRQRTIRLVYAHPPGVVMYPNAFKRWLEHTAARALEGRFRWMTMAQYTDFANRRQAVQWSVTSGVDDATASSSKFQLRASHPIDLEQMTWLLPARRFAEPLVVQGSADVAIDGDYWRVTATGGMELAVEFPEVAVPVK